MKRRLAGSSQSVGGRLVEAPAAAFRGVEGSSAPTTTLGVEFWGEGVVACAVSVGRLWSAEAGGKDGAPAPGPVVVSVFGERLLPTFGKLSPSGDVFRFPVLIPGGLARNRWAGSHLHLRHMRDSVFQY